MQGCNTGRESSRRAHRYAPLPDTPTSPCSQCAPPHLQQAGRLCQCGAGRCLEQVHRARVDRQEAQRPADRVRAVSGIRTAVLRAAVGSPQSLQPRLHCGRVSATATRAQRREKHPLEDPPAEVGCGGQPGLHGQQVEVQAVVAPAGLGVRVSGREWRTKAFGSRLHQANSSAGRRCSSRLCPALPCPHDQPYQ